MRIKRVIRFQTPQNDLESEVKVSADISPDISPGILEEDVQPENEISDVGFHPQEMKESTPSAFSLLKRRLEMSFSGRDSNMIGIFGMNADNVIRQIQQEPIYYNVNFLGRIEPPPTGDIYNYIAAMLLEYLQRKTVRRDDLDYERRKAFATIENIYDSAETDDMYGSLEMLQRTAMRNKRDKFILTALNQISRIDDYAALSRGGERKFLLIVELQWVDYKTLKMLSSLQSSELIIIIYSLFKLENIIDSETIRSMGGTCNIIRKFFPIGNYIRAD